MPTHAEPFGSPPAVSVLMAVYDGLPFLNEALDDLLAQTFADFELVVVDDGSTDGSRAMLADYAARDPRVVVVENPENRGLPRALNRGMEACRAPLIARADADDRYEPTRLEEQVAFMRDNPEVGLLSCFVVKIDADGHPFTRATFPTRDGEIRLRELFVNCFSHPGAMYRTDIVRSVGGYDASYRAAQDADLWNRLLPITRAANLPRFLVRYRVHGRSIVQVHKKKAAASAMIDGSAPVRRRALERYLERTLTPDEAGAAVLTFRGSPDADREQVLRGRAVVEEVLAVARRREARADRAFLRAAVAEAYVRLAEQRARTEPALSRSLAMGALRLRPAFAGTRRAGRLAARAVLPQRAVDLLKSVAPRLRRGAA